MKYSNRPIENFSIPSSSNGSATPIHPANRNWANLNSALLLKKTAAPQQYRDTAWLGQSLNQKTAKSNRAIQEFIRCGGL